ncbi:hypothetical protein QC764_0052130 [Podospora pseudoanserina]|uniref:Uncharacterized protein n=1 Tax=Podospora pseudoanserina TaxID=2609844 RepID=A0ABR0ID71_9PEZI|nr:hypothetical protein QC764_0052130 [Podospora pseudoanserina]
MLPTLHTLRCNTVNLPFRNLGPTPASRPCLSALAIVAPSTRNTEKPSCSHLEVGPSLASSTVPTAWTPVDALSVEAVLGLTPARARQPPGTTR